jgi:hypothetical protein
MSLIRRHVSRWWPTWWKMGAAWMIMCVVLMLNNAAPRSSVSTAAKRPRYVPSSKRSTASPRTSSRLTDQAVRQPTLSTARSTRRLGLCPRMTPHSRYSRHHQPIPGMVGIPHSTFMRQRLIHRRHSMRVQSRHPSRASSRSTTSTSVVMWCVILLLLVLLETYEHNGDSS